MAGSALNGLPASITPEDITTVWPRLIEEFEPGQVLSDDNYSVASLFDPELTHLVTDASQDNVKCLLAKTCILMISSAKLDTERSSRPYSLDEWWARFERVDRAVNRFMETMPPVYVGRNNEELSYLTIVHSGIYCAQVQLHSALAGYEIAQAAQDGQPDDFLGAWVSVSDVLIRDIPRLKKIGKVKQALEKENQLAILEKCMERSVAAYPVFSLQLKQIQSLKEQQVD
ncbi:unnamed protein product [Rhizoctonia solani]|uniref:Uncharacterized protein n=1 Tax=Rhizoctonia solani TaxID=456999 RepID=A0A8H3AJN6_9AGAM|nr:unnamed protein product [Rhizoctonia solani]